MVLSEHHCEFGALASLFEKTASDLKLEFKLNPHPPKLLKSKSTVHIAALNFRTLN